MRHFCRCSAALVLLVGSLLLHGCGQPNSVANSPEQYPVPTPYPAAGSPDYPGPRPTTTPPPTLVPTATPNWPAMTDAQYGQRALEVWAEEQRMQQYGQLDPRFDEPARLRVARSATPQEFEAWGFGGSAWSCQETDWVMVVLQGQFPNVIGGPVAYNPEPYDFMMLVFDRKTGGAFRTALSRHGEGWGPILNDSSLPTSAPALTPDPRTPTPPPPDYETPTPCP